MMRVCACREAVILLAFCKHKNHDDDTEEEGIKDRAYFGITLALSLSPLFFKGKIMRFWMGFLLPCEGGRRSYFLFWYWYTKEKGGSCERLIRKGRQILLAFGKRPSGSKVCSGAKNKSAFCFFFHFGIECCLFFGQETFFCTFLLFSGKVICESINCFQDVVSSVLMPKIFWVVREKERSKVL